MVRWYAVRPGWILLLAPACLAPVLAAEPAVPAVDEGCGPLRRLIELQRADEHSLRQFYNLPWSEATFDRLERFAQEARAALERLDFAALGPQDRIDFLLQRDELRGLLAELAENRRRLAEMAALLPFRMPLLALDTARRELRPLDMAAAAAMLGGLPGDIQKTREQIERGRQAEPPADALRVAPAVAGRAAEATGALRGTLNDWFGYYEGYEPDFSFWVRKPREDADRALDEYAKYLHDAVAGLGDSAALVGEPAGREAVLAALERQWVAYTPEELIAIGERELAACQAEMARIGAAAGLGEGWQAALERVKSDFVPPGEQVALIAAQVRDVIEFLRQHDLLTIPSLAEETWRLTRISPEGQRVMPFAAYGGQQIMLAYAAEAMTHEEKLMAMRGNNRHVSRVFVAHELIPGHHLQAFMAQRHRPYRDRFGTPFFVEGWSLYWEMTLYDQGYAQTPEDRIAMLFWRMHRAARIIVSLRFHLGEMTPAEMVTFLVERVGHERSGATGEVRRFIGDGYEPLYQCAYLIGGLQLRALRAEVLKAGRLSERAFHDRLLTCGPIPIELIRAELLGLTLTPDARPTWRFDQPVAAP